MILRIDPDVAFDNAETAIRQQLYFECAIGCLTTFYAIFNQPIDFNQPIEYSPEDIYDKFRELINPSEEEGTPNQKLVEVASQYFTVTDVGENVYNGGFAIGNIQHPDDDAFHFVAILGYVCGDLAFYDPFNHEIMVAPVSEISWKSGEGYQNWAMNLETPPDLQERILRRIRSIVEKQRAEVA